MLAVLSLAQGALAASPIPAFPKEGTVTVQDVPDSFDKLQALLREHRSPAGAKYHVAVVAFSDPSNRAGPAFGDESGAYLDSVVEAWRQRVDTENAVIILLGLRNREVRVHPFSRWVRLGWEGYSVVKTLKAARFDSYAQAGDYDTGMKELVLAIDAELARRLKAEEDRVAHRLKAEADALQRNKDLIARAHSGILSFESQVKQTRYVPPGAREAHARAISTVASAQRALEEADPRKAFDLAERAVSDAALAARLLTGFEALEAATRTRQREFQTRAAALEQTLGEAPFEVSQERALLERTALALQESERLLAAGSPAEAASRLTNAEASLQAAEEGLVGSRQAHEFKTRTVPRTAAGVIALALLAWLVTQLRRSARSKREAQGLIQQWQTLLGQLAGNLLRLEDEHRLFLGRADLVGHFDGATAGPVREAAREVDGLFLSYDAAQRVLSAAKEELAHAGPLPWLRVRPYQRAILRLTVDEVVARTEDVTSHKLYLPGHREVRMSSRELVAVMQYSWERALRLVDALETPSRSTWETLERLKGELGTLESLEGRLVELNVSSALRDETAELEPQLLALEEKARRDPLGAAEKTQALARRVSTLLTRTGRLEALAKSRELDAVDAPFQESETRSGDVALARQAPAQALTAMARTLTDASGGLVEHERLQLGRAFSELSKTAAVKRPDGPTLLQRDMVLAEEEISAAVARWPHGVDAKPRAQDLLRALTTWRDTYAGILGRSPKEHEATLALLLTVSQQLDDAVLLSLRPTPSWPRIVVTLQRAARGFEAVSRGAKKGFPLPRVARKALAAADEALRDVDAV